MILDLHTHTSHEKTEFKIILDLHAHTRVMKRQRKLPECSGERTISTTFLPPHPHFSFVLNQ